MIILFDDSAHTVGILVIFSIIDYYAFSKDKYFKQIL